MSKSKVKVRNPVVRAAASLMAKGGAHTRSPSSNRRQMQQALNDEVQDYLAEREFERSQTTRGQTVAPGDLSFDTTELLTELLKKSCAFSGSVIAFHPPYKQRNLTGI